MRIGDFFLLLLTLILWAGYYPAGQYALELFPPFFLTALRFLVVTTALFPWMLRLSDVRMKEVMIVSFFLGTLNFGCGLAALGWGLDVATTIVVSQLGVAFSCMFGAILLKDRLGPWRSFGLVVALLGAVCVAGTPNVADNFTAFTMMLIASCSWGYANILMKRYGETKIFPFLGWVSFWAGWQVLAISLLTEEGQWEALQHMHARELGGIVYLGICSTVMAYGLWSYLLHRYPASQVTPYSMLSPFFGFAVSSIFLGTTFSSQVVIAALITIAGVSIIVIRRPRIAFLARARKPKTKQEGAP